MPLPTLIRLNGKLFTRASVSIRVNGIIRISDVDTMEWSDEIAFELVNGMNEGGVPLGKAQGNYNCAASIGVYADSASFFEQAIIIGSPLAGTNLAAATFQLSVQMREDVRTRTVILVNCNIVGRPSRTVSNDGTAIVMQYQLQPVIVLEDGFSLVSLTPAL